jgi:hypothetical protein
METPGSPLTQHDVAAGLVSLRGSARGGAEQLLPPSQRRHLLVERRLLRQPALPLQECLQSKRLVIESWWVSTPLASAGELRPRRLNN